MCSYSILYGSLRLAASTEPVSSTYTTRQIELSKSRRANGLEWNERSGGAFCEAERVQCKEVSRLLWLGGRPSDVVSRVRRLYALCEASFGGVVAISGGAWEKNEWCRRHGERRVAR